MFAAVPLFMAEMQDRLELLAMKCLTVLGGFLAGYVGGLLAGWGFDRWVYKGKTPGGLKRTAGTALGLVVALIIALMIFRFGDGGGTGGGTGADEGSGKAGPVSPADLPAAKKDERPPPKVEALPTPEKGPGDVSVPVTFLGGADVVGDKFYLLDGGRLTFDELKAVLAKRKAEAGGRNVFLLVQFPAANRIADDSVNVSQVTDWAKGAGFQVVFPGRP
ncbi:MAG: hypothetical protein K2X82_07190 [Gemmataceae bacterium]|nr:hypothetical protein [Gemmataceae bacterium]